MKKLTPLLVLIIFFSCGNAKKDGDTASGSAADASKPKEHTVYGVESGILEMTYMDQGKHTESKDIIYFDQFGKRQAKYVFHPAADGKGLEASTAEIRLGDTSFILNLHDMTGLKMDNSMSMITAMAGADFPEVAQQKTFGASKKADATVMGKTCEVYETNKDSMFTQKYLYKGIIMKTVVKMKGMNVECETTRFEEGAKIPEDKMKVPAGIKYTL
ncbi:MAG: hypothetical protein ACHQRM_06895 [Bacteroidia bacterium]